MAENDHFQKLKYKLVTQKQTEQGGNTLMPDPQVEPNVIYKQGLYIP